MGDRKVLEGPTGRMSVKSEQKMGQNCLQLEEKKKPKAAEDSGKGRVTAHSPSFKKGQIHCQRGGYRPNRGGVFFRKHEDRKSTLLEPQ